MATPTHHHEVANRYETAAHHDQLAHEAPLAGLRPKTACPAPTIPALAGGWPGAFSRL